MDEFHAILIAGLFYRDDDGNYRVTEGADSSVKDLFVGEILEPCVGSRMEVVFQFLPPNPPLRNAWGWGCCHWGPLALCPAGHHEDPGKMLNFSHTGILRYAEGRWWVEGEQDHDLPLGLMEGHDGRIVMVSSLTPEALRKKAERDVDLKGLQEELASVKGILEKLKGVVKG